MRLFTPGCLYDFEMPRSRILRIASIFFFSWLISKMMVMGMGTLLISLAVLVIFFIVGSASPRGLFLAMIVLLPFERGIVPGFPLTLYLCLIMAIFGFGTAFLRKPSFPPTLLNPALFGFLFVVTLSIIQTNIVDSLLPTDVFQGQIGVRGSVYRGWYQLAGAVMMLTIFFFTVISVKDEAAFKLSLKWFIGITVAVVIFGFYELFAKLYSLPLITPSSDPKAIWYISKSRWNFGGVLWPRVYSTFVEPGEYANYLLISLSVTCSRLFCAIKEKKRIRKPLFLTLFFLAGMFTTFSTAGWICTAGVMVILFWFYRSVKLVRFFVTAGLILGALIFCFSGDRIKDIITDAMHWQEIKLNSFFSNRADLDFRVEGRQIFKRAFDTSPWLGVGLGNEPFYSGKTEYLQGSSNHYLTVLSETGIFGFLMFFWIILTVFRALFFILHRLRTPELKEFKPVIIGFIAAFCGILVFHVTRYGRFLVQEWYLMGMIMAFYNIVSMKYKTATNQPAPG